MRTRSHGTVLWVTYAVRGFALAAPVGLVLGAAAGLVLVLRSRKHPERCTVCGGTWVKP